MGALYIIATPIGNLKDITLRAIEVLKESDVILCEDTRVARKLLWHYNIHKPLISCHQHSSQKIYHRILEALKRGKKLALVTDSGTPGISDPGSRLINFIIQRLPDINIIPIPGPSALTAALSVAGITKNKFVFLGFPPAKKGRNKFFSALQRIQAKDMPVVFYESPHRIERTLKDLAAVLDKETNVVVCRELTKIHEEIFRGSIQDALSYFHGERQKGEFVVVIA